MNSRFQTLGEHINRYCELIDLINDYRKHPPKFHGYSCDENGGDESPEDPKRHMLAQYQEELQEHLKIILNN